MKEMIGIQETTILQIQLKQNKTKFKGDLIEIMQELITVQIRKLLRKINEKKRNTLFKKVVY